MTIAATHSRSIPTTVDPDPTEPSAPVRPAAGHGGRDRSGPAPRALDARQDDSVRRFVDARRDAPRLGDGVLYVGMNSTDGQCDREAALLARTGGGVRRSIGHGERDPRLGADHARLASGVVVDLGTPDGVRALVEGFGLDAETTSAVIEIVSGAPVGSRDELGALAAVFAQGERGGDVPSRLVLSGHCVGDAVYDGAQVLGWLRFSDVMALARAMPRAAAQVEDVMLSACNSGHAETDDPLRVAIGAWCEPFPNLKTVWAYASADDSHSPTGDVALKHIEAWELATRGRQAHLDPRGAIRRVAGGHGVGYEANIAVWSANE